MKIEKPMFVVGVGRSGSTVLHRIFSEHPNVTWLSSEVCDRFPNRPALNKLHMQTIDYPVVGRFLRKVFSPGEPYSFWEYHCKGFSEPCRDLLAEDVTDKIRAKIPSVMSKMLTRQRNRLLIKITGWPRIGFLHEIFNDAKFIHIKRDRRAVINSLINVSFWSGWRGPQNWRWGELTPAQMEEWERFNRSFIALAGIELKILADAMEKAKRSVDDDNLMEVEYEHLCADTLGIFKKIVRFCELKWSPKFEDAIKKYHLKSTNYKWQQELTSEQQRIVEYFAKQ